LSAVIQSAVAITRPLIENKQHRLRIELPREALHLDGDPHRLAQVFSSLLHNSAKYSTAGGHITVQAERREGEILVSVSDRGIGIPHEMLPRVFDLFVQANRSANSSQDGLGLGLTLARRLVELHGGSIEAHSDGPGQGSRFVVKLPAASAPHAVPVTGRQNESSTTEHAASARVLVADDNRDAALSLSLLLQLSGYETRTAFDGVEAVDVAEEFRPDVVLLDIGMPRLDGYGAARELRSRPWTHDVMICALTGWEQEIATRRASGAAFDHHFVKPVNPQELQNRLAEGLHGR
jgi:CheY-like chemotaxis protein